MAERRSQKPLQGDALGMVIAENVSEFYVNSMSIGVTPWDFMLFFGSTQLPPRLQLGAASFQTGTRVDAVIRMSPQHSKATLRGLQQSIDDWEHEYGEIRIPDAGEG